MTLNEITTRVKAVGDYLTTNHKIKSIRREKVLQLCSEHGITETLFDKVFSDWHWTEAAEVRKQKKLNRKK